MLRSKPNSSLSFQITMFCDNYYSWIWFALSLAIFVFKGYSMIYPRLYLGGEIAGIFLVILVQHTRLYLGDLYAGSVGNKIEGVIQLIWFIVLSIPVLIGSIYYLFLQVYV